ncbi:MAG: hypothetical protein HY650_11610 [Acidobacteria bacterium]|nr:hypothetical protein [Acidobacteriota bacterium]
MARAIAELSDVRKTVPKEIELGLSGFARGSLILGFSLPTLEQIEDLHNGQFSLLREEDPIYKAAREAIHVMGVVKQYVVNGQIENLPEAVPNPKVRDTALTAIRDFTPTGKMGIDAVNLAGQQVGDLQSQALTPKTRVYLREKLARPVATGARVDTLTGEVREIDLDAHRFELRQIENFRVSHVRCGYWGPTDEEAAEWVNHRVRVSGPVERDAEGRASLLVVETIEILS